MVIKSTPFRGDDRADSTRQQRFAEEIPTTDVDRPSERFRQVTKGARRTLFRAKTVFPFTFFQDEVIIDENKVDIAYGLFFGSREVFSIPLPNINGAVSTVGLFFGALDIEVEGYNRNPDAISHLWRKDALTARRIITGLVTAYRQNIDLSKLDLHAVREKLIEIGRAQEKLPVS